eukprot:GHVP01016206.1.p1 GENE.GHVP01016206.1~~GHVP01016206.1.p1  ORF type:complete len:155 (-),score=10.41 GHVP01016206.1:308-772(-)
MKLAIIMILHQMMLDLGRSWYQKENLRSFFRKNAIRNSWGDILKSGLKVVTKISKPGREEYELTTYRPKKIYKLLKFKIPRCRPFIYWSDLQRPYVFYKVTERLDLQDLDKFCKECETRELPLPEDLKTWESDFTPGFLNEALESLATANHCDP